MCKSSVFLSQSLSAISGKSVTLTLLVCVLELQLREVEYYPRKEKLLEISYF